MSYLLDTNACIAVLNGSSPSLIARFSREGPGCLALCSVVKAELFYGARRSQHIAQNLEKLRVFMEPLPSLPFDDAAAEQYGLIRADLAAAGRPIGANDLLIAAIARSHDAVVVTRNLSEFSRVVGLRVENWQEE